MMRVGQGYDVHRLEPGDGVTLAGVFIACDRSLRAHSDGDVVLHAVADALLGAAALGDIGRHFPDTDPAWRGADSRELLSRVIDMVCGEGWRPANIDITVVAQAPKLAPHVEAMREALAEVAHMPVSAISIKATTHEGLGALGRGEGIAAHAVCLLEGH